MAPMQRISFNEIQLHNHVAALIESRFRKKQEMLIPNKIDQKEQRCAIANNSNCVLSAISEKKMRRNEERNI